MAKATPSIAVPTATSLGTLKRGISGPGAARRVRAARRGPGRSHAGAGRGRAARGGAAQRGVACLGAALGRLLLPAGRGAGDRGGRPAASSGGRLSG